jgi:hypothetical protein
VIRMRQGLGKSRACEIEDGSKTALFSPLCVEARFWLAWDSSDLPRLLRLGLRLGLRFTLALDIERHCSADEILQGRLIDPFAFVNVDSAPDIPLEAGVE